MQNAQKTGLHELRFGDGSGYAEHGFAGKENRSFLQSPNVAGKAELREIFEELGLDVEKGGQRAQVGDVFRGEAHLLEKPEGLLQPRGDQVIAAARQGAHKKFKGGAGLEAGLDISARPCG